MSDNKKTDTGAIENSGLTDQRKIEKYDEINEMLNRAMANNWSPSDVMDGLIKITAFA